MTFNEKNILILVKTRLVVVVRFLHMAWLCTGLFGFWGRTYWGKTSLLINPMVHLLDHGSCAQKTENVAAGLSGAKDIVRQRKPPHDFSRTHWLRSFLDISYLELSSARVNDARPSTILMWTTLRLTFKREILSVEIAMLLVSWWEWGGVRVRGMWVGVMGWLGEEFKKKKTKPQIVNGTSVYKHNLILILIQWNQLIKKQSNIVYKGFHLVITPNIPQSFIFIITICQLFSQLVV